MPSVAKTRSIVSGENSPASNVDAELGERPLDLPFSYLLPKCAFANPI